MPHDPLRIATRGSALARWQADWISRLLHDAGGERPIEIVLVATTGDRDRATQVDRLGTQGVFTREVQQAVLDGRADLAVHSLKDLPTEPVDGMVLGAVPRRAAVEDAVVLPAGPDGPVAARQPPHTAPLPELPPQARVGTGSLRRRAQLAWLRSDLVFSNVRGNVDTRLRKLDEGQFDALVLARAGLLRLGFEQRVSTVLDTTQVLPAVGQGAVGVECRADDPQTRAWLARIDHWQTHIAVLAERALLAALRGGCQAPVAALAKIDQARLSVQAAVLSPDGARRITAAQVSPQELPQQQTPAQRHRSAAEALGRQVAEQLLQQGAEQMISSARREPD